MHQDANWVSPMQSGRRRPEPIKGSEFVIDVDTVIAAVGEVPDLSFLDTAKFATERQQDAEGCISGRL